jgi:hypothetical protein
VGATIPLNLKVSGRQPKTLSHQFAVSKERRRENRKSFPMGAARWLTSTSTSPITNKKEDHMLKR